jgi:hypothetical protein
VVPSKITAVPSSRSVKSKVVPDGTATSDKTIVEQDFLDSLAEAAPLEPEKVHEASEASAAAVIIALAAVEAVLGSGDDVDLRSGTVGVAEGIIETELGFPPGTPGLEL